MMFRNSVRLILSNFSNVWKLLLYYVICTIISFAILYPIASPIISKLSAAHVFTDIQTLFNGLFSQPNEMATSLDQVFVTIGEVFSANARDFLPNYILFGVVVLFVMPFIYGLGELTISEVLYGFMTSQTNYGFTACFIRKLGKACVLNLSKMIFTVPMNIITILSLYGVVKLLATKLIGNIVAAVFVMLLIIVYIAFKNTLFSCWTPATAVHNVGPFKAMILGWRAVFHNFWSIFSTAVAVMIFAIVVNFIFGVFTFTIAFVVTMPLTIFTWYVFHMVAYFSNQGMRFYVYPDMFITPKRIKEQETIKRLKFYL